MRQKLQYRHRAGRRSGSSAVSAITWRKLESCRRPADGHRRAVPGQAVGVPADPASVIGAAARQAVVDQVRAAATGAGPVRPDVAVVLALAGPCRLLERVAPDRSTRREAKRRIARATAEAPFVPGVAKIVEKLIAAVTATAAAIAAAWLLERTPASPGRSCVPMAVKPGLHPSGADQALIGASTPAHADELPNQRAVASGYADGPRRDGGRWRRLGGYLRPPARCLPALSSLR